MTARVKMQVMDLARLEVLIEAISCQTGKGGSKRSGLKIGRTCSGDMEDSGKLASEIASSRCRNGETLDVAVRDATFGNDFGDVLRA